MRTVHSFTVKQDDKTFIFIPFTLPHLMVVIPRFIFHQIRFLSQRKYVIEHLVYFMTQTPAVLTYVNNLILHVKGNSSLFLFIFVFIFYVPTIFLFLNSMFFFLSLWDVDSFHEYRLINFYLIVFLMYIILITLC